MVKEKVELQKKNQDFGFVYKNFKMKGKVLGGRWPLRGGDGAVNYQQHLKKNFFFNLNECF